MYTHPYVSISLSLLRCFCAALMDGFCVLLSAARRRQPADDESLDPEQRIAFSWKRANPVGQLYPLIAHKTMVKFSIILGPTYLLAAVAYNLLSQLYPPPSPLYPS